LDCLLAHNRYIGQRMSTLGDVCNVGMIDSEASARRAAEQLNAANVDLVFCKSLRYRTNYSKPTATPAVMS